MTTANRVRRRSIEPRPPQAVKRTKLDLALDDVKHTLLTPTTGRRLRIIRIWAVTLTADSSQRWLELYFGTGATADTNLAKIIDILILPTTGQASTRTYDTLSVGRSPTGLVNEVVSYRWRNAPTLTHTAFAEYIEEHSPGRIA